MAIAGVGSVAASLDDGISGAGRIILGGDLDFSLIQRQASDAERSFLDAQGKVSVAATLRAMARNSDGRSSLVEAKAVDGNYPLYGVVTTDPAMPLSDLLAQNGSVFGAVVDPALLTRLDLKIGDRINIGAAVIELRAALTSEPDKFAGSIGLGPRVLVSDIGAASNRPRAARQPGALAIPSAPARYDASDNAVTSLQKQAEAKFPDAGWEIRSRNKASPQLERSVDRFTQFLTLVGLTTLLVGGVGVANAVTSHLARKRDVIGTLKALGASGGGVFAIYCAEIMLVALLATCLGAALGAALPFIIAWWLRRPHSLAGDAGTVSGRAGARGILWSFTALAFALWPLGRAHDISVSMLFRDQIAAERHWPRGRYLFATMADRRGLRGACDRHHL